MRTDVTSGAYGVDAASLRRVQKRRKLAILIGLVAALAILSVTQSYAGVDSIFRNSVDVLGGAMIVLCILGRTWSSLYIAGNKRAVLVDAGPFSVVRNPLYVFSIVGACGIGFSTGSVVVGVVFAVITFFVFHLVVLSEERYLREKFGTAFDDYTSITPRWLPRVSAWRDAEWVRVRPSDVLSTFLEACLLLIAIPLCDGIQFMQDGGILPVLLKVP